MKEVDIKLTKQQIQIVIDALEFLDEMGNPTDLTEGLIYLFKEKLGQN